MIFDYLEFDNHKFRIIRDKNNLNKFFLLGIDVAKYFQYKYPKCAIYKLVSPFNKFKFFVYTSRGRKSAHYLYPNGIKELIFRSKISPHKISKFCNFLNLDFFILPYTSTFCTDIIISSFSDYYPIREYPVPPYKIDIYFPSVRLAIEFDEFNHNGYDKYNEKIREDYIVSTLNCSIIRVNPYSPNFNLGNLIFTIRQYLS